MIRGRLRHPGGEGGGGDDGDEFVEIDAAELRGVFATPSWLRDVGMTSWLLVGVTLLLAGVVGLLALTETIVMPVITAGVIAAVAGPIVRWLQARGLPRAAGAAVVLLSILVLAVVVVILIVGGITSQVSDLQGDLSGAKAAIQGWLQDVGVSSKAAGDATRQAGASITDAVSALLVGIGAGISGLASLAFFAALTILSLFFLLKDGPVIRAWGERHAGVPVPVARTIIRRVLQSLRGYFVGVTLVAAFNAVVVGGGALLLGVPQAGTIAVITFLGAYIPYLGAWGAGAFAVLIALGGAGKGAAAGMIIIQLLANGALQQMVQPFAMGAALGIHPLAVLVVTIGGGALFGAVGLILGAPITSAIVRISADLARAHAEKDQPDAAPGPGQSPPRPAPA
jgi:putative heme transporter